MLGHSERGYDETVNIEHGGIVWCTALLSILVFLFKFKYKFNYFFKNIVCGVDKNLQCNFWRYFLLIRVHEFVTISSEIVLK